MLKFFGAAIAAGAVLAAATEAAFAHVTLETQEAAGGSAHKAGLRGPPRRGGQAAPGPRGKNPGGLLSVEPMPEGGWEAQTVKGNYARSYELGGEAVPEGVTEVDCTGGALPDEFYGESVSRGTLAGDRPAGEKLFFPVVQECGDAAERWIEIPAAGGDEEALELPAPGLTLLPKK